MNDERKPQSVPKLVVGVGASAGGLEAFKQLLGALPSQTGMAFLLVQHLDPTHKSLLTELLSPCTSMLVKEAEHGEPLAADVVYVIPADAALAVREGHIELTPPTLQRGARLSVDHLFRSLARAVGAKSVGIVLSGAGADGSAGLRDIKAAGGLVLVQDPDTCAQQGMPQSAIDTGTVDLIVRLSDIPAALDRFEQLPASVRAERPETVSSAEPPFGQLGEGNFTQLAAVLEASTGFDLSVYKSGTVSRRVLRRMALSGHESLDAYLEQLRRDPSEQRTIVRDLLISVTEFFRDHEAFEALRAQIIEPMVEAARHGETLRVWVPGCATGEEPYSIAMAVLAAADRQNKRISLQLFATDVDQEALSFARAGQYPPTIEAHVPAQLLGRYMIPHNGRGYQVRPMLRDAISFAAHDVTKDPPFSRMHLVSCRNLLIYLQPHVQEQVLKALHFSLLPSGYLMLGSSETTGAQRDLFSTISKAWRLYRKGAVSAASKGRSGSQPPPGLLAADGGGRGVRLSQQHAHSVRPVPGAAEMARRAVMRERVAPTIVLSDSGAVLYMHGELRPFLQFPEGGARAGKRRAALLQRGSDLDERGAAVRQRGAGSHHGGGCDPSTKS